MTLKLFITIVTAALAAVTSANAAQSADISVAWDYSGTNHTGFVLQSVSFSPPGINGGAMSTNSFSVAPGASTFTFTNLTVGLGYFFLGYATNQWITSPHSEVLMFNALYLPAPGTMRITQVTVR